MANVLTVVWFVIAYVAAQTSLMVWGALMFPNRVQRARVNVESRPVACFFRGLLFWGINIALAMAFLKEGNPGPLQLMGWLIVGPMLAGSVLGGAAFAEIVAERIRTRSDSAAVMPSLIGGALFTTLGGLMPVIGWFVFFPLVSLISVGAGFPALFRARKPKADARPVEHLPAQSRLEEFAPLTTAYQIPQATGAAYESSEMAHS